MKFTCCCFTCIIGEDPILQAEQERLIQKEEKPASHPPEAQEHAALSPPTAKSEQEEDEERIHRAVGILKKYQVSLSSSKYDEKKIQRVLSSDVAVDLKISIKIMARSDTVKIFVLEATNVVPMIMAKVSESSAPSADDPLIVQVRTKLMPLDSRAHSKKYEVCEGITGAMKFMNECLHSITIAEYQSQHLRFRLYNVFSKPKRDVLLGEYVLDLAGLSLEMESGTTNVLMQLHNTEADVVKPPDICEKRLSLSSASASSTQSSRSSAKSFKTTIRRGDTKGYSRSGMPSFSESHDEEANGDAKHKALFSGSSRSSHSNLQTVEEKADQSFEITAAADTAFEHVRKGLHERTENLSRAEDASEEMSHAASRFNEMSVRLREKYQKKVSKKHSHD